MEWAMRTGRSVLVGLSLLGLSAGMVAAQPASAKPKPRPAPIPARATPVSWETVPFWVSKKHPLWAVLETKINSGSDTRVGACVAAYTSSWSLLAASCAPGSYPSGKNGSYSYSVSAGSGQVVAGEGPIDQ